MDILQDINAFSGIGGYDPFIMINAVRDITNSLKNPYSDLNILGKNISDDQKALLVALKNGDYSQESKIEENLLKNEMLLLSGNMTKPYESQEKELSNSAILFGEMLLYSLVKKASSKISLEILNIKLKSDQGIEKFESFAVSSKNIDDIDVLQKQWVSDMGLPTTDKFGGLSTISSPSDGEDVTGIPKKQNSISTIFTNTKKTIDAEIKYKKIIEPEIPNKNSNVEDKSFFGITDLSEEQSNSLNTNITHSAELSTSIPDFPVFGEKYDNLSLLLTTKLNNATTIDNGDTVSTNDVYNNKFPGVIEDSNLSELDTSTNKYKLKTKIKRTPLFKGWGIIKEGKWIPDPLKTFTQETPFSEVISKNIIEEINEKNTKQPKGTVKFFIEKLHGRHADNTPNQRGNINSNKNQKKPVSLDNRMLFSAFIENYSESYSPSFDNYNFIGRGEAVPIYKSTTRSLNLTFNIIADYSLDLMIGMQTLYENLNLNSGKLPDLDNILNKSTDWGLGYIGNTISTDNQQRHSLIQGRYLDTTETLWEKVTFLAQCCYPHYRTDGKMKEQPIIRLRLVDFYDVVGYIESLNIDSNEFENMIDLNESNIGNIPFAVKISMNFKIIHDNEPSSDFYGFYHRKEFDTSGIPTKPPKNLKDQITSKSPISFGGAIKEEGLTDTPDIISSGDINNMISELQNFQSKFADVNSIGIKMDEAKRKVKLQNAMNAYVKVSNITNDLAKQYSKKIIVQSGIPQTINDINIQNINPNKESIVDTIKNNTINNNPNNIPNNNLNNIKGPNIYSDITTNTTTVINKSVISSSPKTFQDIINSK